MVPTEMPVPRLEARGWRGELLPASRRGSALRWHARQDRDAAARVSLPRGAVVPEGSPPGEVPVGWFWQHGKQPPPPLLLLEAARMRRLP